MPQGDAVAKVPTIEEEMASFKGFSVENGEVKSVVADSAEERAAAASRAEADRAAAAVVKKAEEKENGEATEDGEEKPAPKAAKKLEEYADDETITAAEARKLLASAVSGRLGEERRRARAQAQQRDTELREMRDRLARLESGGLTRKNSGGSDANADEAPDPKKYEFGELDIRYIEDRTRYAVRQELRTQREKDTEAQQRDAATRKTREIAQQREALAEKGAEKYPDFAEVVLDTTWSEETPDGWPLSPTLGALILENPEVGRDIAYELASNPKEARRVFGLSPEKQAAYFGRLEARFTSSKSPDEADSAAAKPAAQSVKVTQVPPPPENRAKGKNATQPAADTQDFKAFERMAGYG